MVCLEVFRVRSKEKEEREEDEGRGGEVVDPAPSPYQLASDKDELRIERERALEAALTFPPPYGHVLIWRLIEGLAWEQIQDRLNAHRLHGARPIERSRTFKIAQVAIAMLREYLQGQDVRSIHWQKFLAAKNSWIGGLQPLSRHLYGRGARGRPW